MNTGTKMDAPLFSRALADDHIAYRAAFDSKFDKGSNWKHAEDKECDKCHGTGHNPEFPGDAHCMGCEGTGTHIRLVYGVEDGKPFAYTYEFGIDYLKEVCKAEREAHRETQLAGKVGNLSMIRPFRLPKTLEMEMLHRGYDLNDMKKNRELRKAANIVAREFPHFMCVNYKNF